MKYAALAALALVSCGSTGSDRFTFEAQARGNTPATFTNANGWSFTLSKAQFTFGPVYLTPQRGRDAERHVGEVLDQVTVDALSDAPVVFPSAGAMTEDNVRTAEIWFWPPPGIAPETVKITSAAAEFAGEAARVGANGAAERVRFHGRLVIDDAWASAAKPGEHSATPITEIRKVVGIPTVFYPREGGALEIRIDARQLFAGADFSDLVDASNDVHELSPTHQVMKTAFAGLRATATYEVQWFAK